MAVRLRTCSEYRLACMRRNVSFSLIRESILQRPTSQIHLTLSWFWRGSVCNYVIVTAIWSSISCSREALIRDNVAVKRPSLARLHMITTILYTDEIRRISITRRHITRPSIHSFISGSTALSWALTAFSLS
jgi:hypothetical protein